MSEYKRLLKENRQNAHRFTFAGCSKEICATENPLSIEHGISTCQLAQAWALYSRQKDLSFYGHKTHSACVVCNPISTHAMEKSKSDQTDGSIFRIKKQANACSLKPQLTYSDWYILIPPYNCLLSKCPRGNLLMACASWNFDTSRFFGPRFSFSFSFARTDTWTYSFTQQLLSNSSATPQRAGSLRCCLAPLECQHSHSLAQPSASLPEMEWGERSFYSHLRSSKRFVKY